MRHLLISLIAAALAWSAPAFPGLQTFTQPDGTAFAGRAQGDEFLHWVETEKGEILLFSKERKRFEHARIESGALKPSGLPFVPGEAVSVPAPERQELHRLWKSKRSEAVGAISGHVPKSR